MEEHSILTSLIIQEELAFAGLRREWNDLAKASSSTIYQTWDWASAWWKTYAQKAKCRLFIILFRDGENLVGICPLFMERISLWGLVVGYEIRFIGSSVTRGDSKGLYAWYSPTDYLDAIVLPGSEDEVFSRLSRTLWTEISKGDRSLLLTNLAEGSALRKHLPRYLTRFPVKVKTTVIETCPKIDLPASVDDFMCRLDSSARRRWRKIRCAVENTETFHVRSIKTPDAFDVAFNSLRSLHQCRWQKAGFPGVFFDKRFGTFLEKVCRDLFAAGNVWFSVLEHHGRIVAARLGFTLGDTIYDYLSGFDDGPEIAKFRPGLMLLYSMIKDAIAMNLRVLDLLRGDEAYKVEITSRLEHSSEITAMKSGVSGVARSSSIALVLALLKLRHRIEQEMILLRVQMKNAGFFQAISKYVVFRAAQIASKAKHMEDSKESADPENQAKQRNRPLASERQGGRQLVLEFPESSRPQRPKTAYEGRGQLRSPNFPQ